MDGRYTYIDGKDENSVWHGSLLVVVKGEDDSRPTLVLHVGDDSVGVKPLSVFQIAEKDYSCTFWRFPLQVKLTNKDQRIPYELETSSHDFDKRSYSFWVPSKDESMRILFHSCNGFSLGVVDKGTYTNLALWNDVLKSTFLPSAVFS